MKKICVCGHFAGGNNAYDGQTIKTRSIYDELVRIYGKENVCKIDTYHWKRNPWKIFKNCIKMTRVSTDIVILPAHKGVKIFVPLFNGLKKIYSFKLHYIVIGGWLPSLIKDNIYMQKELKKVDCIYIENHKTIKLLDAMGMKNLFKMNNFKNLVLSDYYYNMDMQVFRCCIFSRIEEKKGISDAIDVIAKIASNYDIDIVLDIYGKVSDDYKDIFDKKLIEHKSCVCYKGVVEAGNSVETIEKYDLLLFPTLYYTEGIPGTIIDAFFAGVPVLASKWENYDEILEDGITGFSYELANKDDFYEKLDFVIKNRNLLQKMRDNCRKKAREYTPEVSLMVLLQNIGE